MISIVYSARPTFAAYRVTHDAFVVGRGHDCDLLIVDPLMARRQLEVTRALVVRDLAGGAFADGGPLVVPRAARIVRAGETILVLGATAAPDPLPQQVCDTLAAQRPALPPGVSLIEAVLLDPTRLHEVAEAARRARAAGALRVEAAHLHLGA